MEELRLECLRLAMTPDKPSDIVVTDAERYIAFILGNDRADAVKAAKDAIDALR